MHEGWFLQVQSRGYVSGHSEVWVLDRHKQKIQMDNQMNLYIIVSCLPIEARQLFRTDYTAVMANELKLVRVAAPCHQGVPES